jgi:hypothetical protein
VWKPIAFPRGKSSLALPMNRRIVPEGGTKARREVVYRPWHMHSPPMATGTAERGLSMSTAVPYQKMHPRKRGNVSSIDIIRAKIFVLRQLVFAPCCSYPSQLTTLYIALALSHKQVGVRPSKDDLLLIFSSLRHDTRNAKRLTLKAEWK